MDDHLKSLREQLDAAERTGPESDRAELSKLRAEVDTHTGSGDHHRLADSLAHGETRFESGHPKLTAAIRQVLEALSSSGI